MAVTDIRDALKVFLVADDPDATRKQAQLIRAGIDRVQPPESPIFNRMKVGEKATEQTYWWQEEPVYEIRLTAQLTTDSGSPAIWTLTFSGKAMQADITADTMKQHIWPNCMVMRQSDGIQARVVSVNYSGLSCVVAAHSDYTLTADNAAVTWELLAPSIADYTATRQPMSTDTLWRYCGTQILRLDWEVPHTWKNTKYVNISDKVAEQYQRITYQGKLLLARSALMSAPMYSGGKFITGRSTTTPTMTGLCQWPRIMATEKGAGQHTYVSISGNKLSIKDLDDLIYFGRYEEKCSYTKGDWCILANTVHQRHIGNLMIAHKRAAMTDTTAGTYIDKIRSKDGHIFNILYDDNFPMYQLIVCDLGKQNYGWYEGDEWWTKSIPTGDRTEQIMITGQAYGTAPRIPRQILEIHDMPIAG